MNDFLLKAKQHYGQDLPFVIYSKPNEQKVLGFFQQNSGLYFSADLEDKGFVLVSFDGEKRILIPEKVSEIITAGFAFDNDTDKSMVASLSNQGKEAFEGLVRKGIQAIENGTFGKVVLSRMEILALHDFDFTIVFEKLVNLYPTAFVYCWFHPEIGMWMGATPEQLLKASGVQFRTVALAGTQRHIENRTIIWGEKEKEEQQFVTDFIIDSLKGITSELKISNPYTLKAGGILHIKTDIEGVLNSENNLQDAIKILHPTPAVCGFPKIASRQFIIENEGYDRDFYAGFLGELNMDFADSNKSSDLFVNLRCMEIKKNQAHLYIGCGITKDSIPEDEYVETANKALTMKKVLTI